MCIHVHVTVNSSTCTWPNINVQMIVDLCALGGIQYLHALGVFLLLLPSNPILLVRSVANLATKLANATPPPSLSEVPLCALWRKWSTILFPLPSLPFCR
jgi:hypothetical protein